MRTFILKTTAIILALAGLFNCSRLISMWRIQNMPAGR